MPRGWRIPDRASDVRRTAYNARVEQTVLRARQSILESLRIPEGIPPRASRELAKLFDDLRVSARVQLWQPVSALAGQILEALLRLRLEQHETRPDVRRTAGLGELIGVARQLGILPDQDRLPQGSHSISAALTLRNWSTHISLWATNATEIRATQCVALLTCACETLFPSPVGRYDAFDHRTETLNWTCWQTYGPGAVVLSLRTHLDEHAVMPTQLEPELGAVFDFVIDHGQLSTIDALATLLEHHKIDSALFKEALVRRFGSVVRRAAGANDRWLLKMFHLLKRLDLADNARVFGVLLPLDVDIFLHLLRTRKSIEFLFYLTACYFAEPALFSSRAHQLAFGPNVVAAFWREMLVKRGRLGVAANIIALLPKKLRTVFLRQAPLETVASHLAQSSLLDCLKVLQDVSEKVVASFPDLQSLRDQVVAATVAAVSKYPLARLAHIPNLLRRRRLLTDAVAEPIVEALFARLQGADPTTIDEWSAVRRMSWDLMLFVESHRKRVIKNVIRRVVKTQEWDWDRAALLGMVALYQRPVAKELLKSCKADRLNLEPATSRVDPWQVCLVAMGMRELSAAFSVAPPEALVDLVSAKLELSIRNDESVLSTKLVAEATQILAVWRPAA